MHELDEAQPNGRPDFEIGLALAGAISAGAYTAGVIDFLVQALQEWEKERAREAPSHRVRIRTMAGASAGAITGALGVVALRHGLRPVELSDAERQAVDATPGASTQRIRCVLPALYQTWVERPRMVAAAGTGAKDLLGTEDLGPRKKDPVRSLLNAALLDDIQATALAGPGPLPAADPGKPYLDPTPGPFPFLAETMHVFVTVTNLRGIPFELGFGASTYGMLTHGDRLHYRIEKIGAGIPGAPWSETVFLNSDTCVPLDATTLPNGKTDKLPSAWGSYGMSAVASAAFPGGLAPRLISTPFAQYKGRQYPLPIDDRSQIEAKFPPSCDLNGDFQFLSVDGGVVNNTPFDYVEYALWNDREPRRAGPDADRAVIMIAPFPEPPTFLGEGSPVAELGSVVKALVPTLMNQARFRSSELGRALRPDDKSRFLISPRRSLQDGPKERYPIACGLLGGFGGFLDEAFRAHDFQLGRRNCQSFLASSFSLPLPPIEEASSTGASPRVQAEASALRADEASRQAAAVVRPYNKATAAEEAMIIPLLGEAQREVGLPPWPRMSGADFRTLVKRIGGRFDAIRDPVIEAQVAKPEIRSLAKILARVSRPRLLNVIALTVLADLVRRDQIAGWDFPPAVVRLVNQHKAGEQAEDIRSILASLVGTSPSTALTAGEIAAALHLEPAFVGRVLDGFGKLPDTCPNRVSKSGERYQLQMHQPTGVRAYPVIGAWIARFSPQLYGYG